MLCYFPSCFFSCWLPSSPVSSERFVIPLGFQSHGPCCPPQLSPCNTTMRLLWILWSSFFQYFLTSLGEGEWRAWETSCCFVVPLWGPKGSFLGSCVCLPGLHFHFTTGCRLSLDGCRWGTRPMSPFRALLHLTILHLSL